MNYTNALRDTYVVQLDGHNPTPAIVARGLKKVVITLQPGGTVTWNLTHTRLQGYQQGYAKNVSAAQGALNRILSAYNTRIVIKP